MNYIGLYCITDFFIYLVFFFINVLCSIFFFFFKQKTAYEMRISDWSSDVCSSDLSKTLCGYQQSESGLGNSTLPPSFPARCRGDGGDCGEQKMWYLNVIMRPH